ncbi:ATP-binding protein [Geobacter sp. DSM 9736]|uniref:ATP-binding protein n=1 Tax=Geobacter sp. DSM 9736 TaxID=1277350 RepID=UPI000B505189|nr:ATP-binding protein [Geobacter sp. DSM 9736]SNB44826.1 Histidine kinase-, DNA gyrase B-, and HSP90-like ATPase [Geobacter sp. DSM 9736]
MIQTAHFKIDPRLAMLLGETYRSTEHALKELVDNAWDADAENVWIQLPEPLTSDPIIIRDDGIGMDEREVRREYLTVARDRRSSLGDLTSWKNRRVKGRKGIGKFAGLMAADIMQLETRAAGTATYLTIPRHDLLAADMDLEQFDLLINTVPCDPSDHGTTITLSDLNQNLSFPSPEKLKELLTIEYGRQRDFHIHVNGTLVDMEDIPGTGFQLDAELPDAGPVRLRFKIVDRRQKLKSFGVAVRVGGKIVGRPGFFGLEQDEELPLGLLRQIYGEVEADGLADDTTADWGAFVENSKGYRVVEQWAAEHLRREALKSFRHDLGLARSRLKKEIAERLAALPEARKIYGEQVMEKVLLSGYGLSDDRIKPIVGALLDALAEMPDSRDTSKK